MHISLYLSKKLAGLKEHSKTSKTIKTVKKTTKKTSNNNTPVNIQVGLNEDKNMIATVIPANQSFQPGSLNNINKKERTFLLK